MMIIRYLQEKKKNLFLRLHLRKKPLQEKKTGCGKLIWSLLGDRLGVVREQVVYR